MGTGLQLPDYDENEPATPTLIHYLNRNGASPYVTEILHLNPVLLPRLSHKGITEQNPLSRM